MLWFTGKLIIVGDDFWNVATSLWYLAVICFASGYSFMSVYGGVLEEFTVCLREGGPRILRSSQRRLLEECQASSHPVVEVPVQFV